MIKKTTTNIVFISSAMALVVSALAYGYLLLVFSNMRTNIKDLYDTHAESKAVLAELNKVEQNLKATLASRDRLLSLLVRQESIVDFIQKLESLMRETARISVRFCTAYRRIKPRSTKRSRHASTVPRKNWTRLSWPSCACPPLKCSSAWTCRIAW